jgi:hypothetical protein
VGIEQRSGELLRRLHDGGVAFVVVGLTAAVLDGAPVTTFDLDVLIDPDPANLRRALPVLESLDASYLDPAGRGLRPNADRLESFQLHLLVTRFGRLDLLLRLDDRLDWPGALLRSHPVELEGRRIRVLDLDAVIESKERADRPKDRAVLPVLRETLRLRGEVDPER